MTKKLVNVEETNERFNKINNYLEDARNLSGDIFKDIDEIQKINQPWISKLSTEKIQKRMNLDNKQRSI